MNAFNQNLIHEFLAFEDVKFSFYPYGCDLYVICNSFSLNIKQLLRIESLSNLHLSTLKNKNTL